MMQKLYRDFFATQIRSSHMVPWIFANAKNIAKNILTIVVNLGVIHSFTWAAEKDE